MSGSSGRVLYVDHSFHQNTKSTAFFPVALAARAEVIERWDDSWRGEGAPPIRFEDVRSLDADRAVFFQTFPSPEFLAAFKKPIAIIPMFDGPPPRNLEPLLAAHNVVVVAFSKAVEDHYGAFGMRVLPIRYARSATERAPRSGAPSLFFWERGQVTWADVKTLIGDQPIGKIHLKLDPDPSYRSSEISDEDRERYDIETISGWISKESYNDILASCDLYVAPRFLEGIGMSFLEAMASGLAVAACDRPTMNEYIVDGQNGYLFDQPPQGPIDFSRAREVGQRAREDIERLERLFHPRLAQVVDEIMDLEYQPARGRALLSWKVREWGLSLKDVVRPYVRPLRRLLASQPDRRAKTL